MKINYLKLAGFRGVKESAEIDFPSGFAVISGRNGSGKSTICDAIEYVLTGTIRAESAHTEKGESIIDYLWWRGDGFPDNRYVTLGLIDDNGEQVTITRDPNGVKISNEKKIDDLVSDPSCSPKNCLMQLCKTSIIRDEEITQLSVDLPERQRFEFVSSAIGTTDFTDIENKAIAVQDYFKIRHKNLEEEYSERRRVISDLTARLSSTKTEAEKYGDVKEAEKKIKLLLNVNVQTETELLEITRQNIAKVRTDSDNLVRISSELVELQKRLVEINERDTKELIQSLEKEIVKINKTLTDKDKEISDLDAKIAKHEIESPRLASLAEIIEHGKRYGLEDGCCPLCNSKVDESSFNSNLSVRESQIKEASASLAELIKDRADTSETRKSIINDLDSKTRKYEELSNIKDVTVQNIQKLINEAGNFGVKAAESDQFDAHYLFQHIEENRKKITELEHSLAILESSRAYEKVGELEKEISLAKKHAAEIEKKMTSAEEAEGQAKNAVGVIRRVSGDIVDERLAQLSPLISEIYFRLRPHLDWQDVNYHIRGDVRRFLSFEVGKGLNPSFLFSSGQRRAAGLSFLLAVHLSRQWCRLKTLILDDPVQHIDDFRALQLTEVLSAIRQSGWQIICTVEDKALANLLSRRLRSSENEEGSHICMTYRSNLGVAIETIKQVPTISNRILMSA